MALDVSQLSMPSISQDGINILEAVRDDSIDLNKVADMVAQDPVLSSTMLRIANSPMYRRSAEISNVRAAVTLLGAKKVRMAVMVVAMRSIEKSPSQIQSALWEHSFGIATLCKLIAQKCFPVLIDDLELTGLMHDMGALVLAANFPREYAQLAKTAAAKEVPVEEAETQVFGVDRGELLVKMSDTLHLPAVTKEALAGFRSLTPLSNIDTDAATHQAVLSMAHHIDYMINDDANVERPKEKLPDAAAAVKKMMGLRDEDMDDIIEGYEVVLNERFSF